MRHSRAISGATSPTPDRLIRYWLVGMLLLIAVLPYGRVLTSGFVGFDDALYVTENRMVADGLSRDGLLWALTTTDVANWQPVTWLSYMLDREMFGPAPWGYHLTNLLLHAANTVALFGVLLRLTGAARRSALVAALFAVHPLNVEVVAWVAQRKTLLAMLFGLLAIGAHGRYASNGEWRHYGACLLWFALSLMAKPLWVTLPFLLLLLDYWPLQRFSMPVPSPARSSRVGPLIEKIPLVVCAAAAGWVTLHAQGSSGAIQPLASLPVGDRLANAMIAYAAYVGKTVWPFGLSVFYPHPGQGLSSTAIFAATGLVATMIAAGIRWSRRIPFLPVGLFWFFGTLLPMIGLVQVGGQAFADRYAYHSLIGLFIVAVWGGWALRLRFRFSGRHAAVAAGVLILLLAVRTGFQTTHWQDGRTLFAHAVRLQPDNALARNNLAVVLSAGGDVDGAIRQLQHAVRLVPSYATARANLAALYMDRRRHDDAMAQFLTILSHAPDHVTANLHLGEYYFRLGQPDAALRHLAVVVRQDPHQAGAFYRIGQILQQKGRSGKAGEFFNKARELNPELEAPGEMDG